MIMMIADLYLVTSNKTNIKKLLKFNGKTNVKYRINQLKKYNTVEFFKKIRYGSHLEFKQLRDYYLNQIYQYYL